MAKTSSADGDARRLISDICFFTATLAKQIHQYIDMYFEIVSFYSVLTVKMGSSVDPCLISNDQYTIPRFLSGSCVAIFSFLCCVL
jgi:hypothetical protein